MADLPSTPQADEVPVYRPISLSALFGLVLSCLFAGILLITSLVALFEGLPIFLPGWAFALAATAAVLCFLAQRHIRNSEGALAGLALARFGLWLSVLLGATYFVYITVTGLALAKQADDFLTVMSSEDSGFFPRLKNAAKNRTDLYQAFLLTLPTTSRGGSRADNPERMLSQYDQPAKDGEAGAIGKFSKHPLVLLLSRYPDTVLIEPLGVVEWKYESNCYHVTRNYRFSTPEAVIEMSIPVQSTEAAREGEDRKWFTPITRASRISFKATPHGAKLQEIRASAKAFVEKWSQQRQDATALKNDDIIEKSDTDWSGVLPKKEQREHVKKTLGEIFQGGRNTSLYLAFTSEDYAADWKNVDGKIEITHPVQILLAPAQNVLALKLDMEIVVVTRDPIDLAAPLRLPLSWDVRTIRVVRAAPAERSSRR